MKHLKTEEEKSSKLDNVVIETIQIRYRDKIYGETWENKKDKERKGEQEDKQEKGMGRGRRSGRSTQDHGSAHVIKSVKREMLYEDLWTNFSKSDENYKFLTSKIINS